MSSTETHRRALQWATELIDMTMGDITPEQLAWQPPGTAHSVAASYAHAVCGADGVVNILLRNGQALYDTSWKDRTGVSEPQWGQDAEWARRVQVDLSAARAYADAVWSAVETYVGGLSDVELGKELDLSSQGLGRRSLDWCLSALVIGHIHNMAGEISAVKGMQGAQGYPF